MPHESSPLSIEGHRFVAFNCEAHDAPSEEGSYVLKTKQKLVVDPENSCRWEVTLKVKFAAENPKAPTPYEGKIKVTGEFEIHETFTEENREALIRVTATSILYGACRELVAGFTSRSIHGELALPSISFRKKKVDIDAA